MRNDDRTVRQIEHTADVGIEVTAADLPSLLCSAGEALYALIADTAGIEAREEISLSVTGGGPEDLLHGWLCELLAQFNIKGFVGRSCEIVYIASGQVHGRVKGETLDLRRHAFHTEIKGVTYHGFNVWEEKDGSWHARVIFDV